VSHLFSMSELTALFAAGSWLMIPLLIVTIGIWYAYLSSVTDLHESLRSADLESLGVEERLRREDPDAVARDLAPVRGAVPRITRHVILRMKAGLSFREACAQCRASETDRFGYGLIVLGALVVAAPLFGLLGTVLGMIDTFNAVATNSSETADLVAGGISKALITTQVGLVAALPGTLGLAHVFRLYRRLANAVDLCETRLALIFEHADEGRGKAA
jgi:biopolymer transport protein ExbB